MAHSAIMTKQNTIEKKARARRVVRIHGLDDAIAACAIAQELDVDITLFSAPDAVASLGPAWFGAIARNVEQAYPNLNVDAVLDCGDAAGYAQAALRSGVKIICYSGNATATRKLKEIAATYGARLVGRPRQILDPRESQFIDDALRQWLRRK
jgi:hypothetical protein